MQFFTERVRISISPLTVANLDSVRATPSRIRNVRFLKKRIRRQRSFQSTVDCTNTYYGHYSVKYVRPDCTVRRKKCWFTCTNTHSTVKNIAYQFRVLLLPTKYRLRFRKIGNKLPDHIVLRGEGSVDLQASTRTVRWKALHISFVYWVQPLTVCPVEKPGHLCSAIMYQFCKSFTSNATQRNT